MAKTFTIDSFIEEAENKYAPVVIELGDDVSVELKPYLKVGSKDRKAILAAFDEIKEVAELGEDEEETDEKIDELAELTVEAIQKIFGYLTPRPKKLFASLDHDDPQIKAEIYMAVLNAWTGATQLGEADSSSS